jgi:Spy/CpxP family protein refolding chaperone
MKHVLKTMIVLALVVAVAAPLSAADDAKEKKKPRKGQGNPAVAAMMTKLKAVELTDDQEAKIKEVAASFTGKFKDAQAKLSEVLGPDQRKARADAMKKAREDGKKGKELQEAAYAALNLDADKLAELKKQEAAIKELQTGFTAAVREVLTAEQIEKAGLRGGKGKGKAKAKPDAKPEAKKPGKNKLPGNPKSETAEKKVD